MLTKEDVLQLLRGEREHLAKEFGVRRIGLFGSFAADRPTESSDVDLVVELDRPLGLRFVELAEHLEALLARRVDLLTPAGIESMRRGNVRQGISGNIVYV